MSEFVVADRDGGSCVSMVTTAREGQVQQKFIYEGTANITCECVPTSIEFSALTGLIADFFCSISTVF